MVYIRKQVNKVRGVCLDAMNPAGRPLPATLKRLGGTGHRVQAVDSQEYYDYVATLHSHGLQVAHVLTGLTVMETQQVIKNTVANTTSNHDVWLIGNEWNVDGDASWPKGDTQFIAYYNAVVPMLIGYLGVQIYIGGMFSEPDNTILDHLARVLPELTIKPTGVDFHPYLDSVSDIQAMLQSARGRFDLQVSVFEWNWSDATITEILSFQSLLNRLTEHSCYFCWSDGMVKPYGLHYNNGARKQVYYQYKQALLI